jgi:hypothetical protein
MQLRRVYKEGKVSGVEILKAGKKQKFTESMLLDGMVQGWMEVREGVISVKGVNETVRYKVVREPGYYCCHCGKRLEGDPRNTADQADNASRKEHVQNEHTGAKSPDPENPAGYMGTCSYKGVRV